MEKDEKTNPCQRLPDYEWDGDIVSPCEARRIAYLIADGLRIGVAYAESRFVEPNVAYDLDKW